MAQFDVHLNPDGATREHSPYVLDVQSNLLSHLATRIVVPLVRSSDFGKPVPRLNPSFSISGAAVVMSTAELGGLYRRELGDVVISLEDLRGDIIGALDYLLTGF